MGEAWKAYDPTAEDGDDGSTDDWGLWIEPTLER